MRINRNKNKNRGKDKTFNNRINIVAAVIFLFVFSILFKLYSLQVAEHDLYIALASDQHDVTNVLEPERGKIFVSDSNQEDGEDRYPVATNKVFAHVYAIPNEITDASGTAAVLFDVLDRDAVASSVAEALDKDETFNELKDENIAPEKKQDLTEYKEIKRETEFNAEKKRIVSGYFEKLSKADDPYEPIKDKVDDATLTDLVSRNLTGIDYLMKRYRFYPDGAIGAQITGFVGFKGGTESGLYGLEGFFNDELAGSSGIVKAERDAKGDVIIINDREYEQAVNGSDLTLTIVRPIEYYACQKLDEGVEKYGASGGSIIVMEPSTGAILAMCANPDFDPNNYGEVDNIDVYNNQAIFSAYEPGSIFKSFTIAAGIDAGKITPETTYLDKGQVMVEGWPKPIKNSDFSSFGGHGVVNMTTVLELSLNTGAIFAMQQTGAEEFSRYIRQFGFGEKTGIELETESAGDITSLLRKTIRPVEAATATFGQGITTTPLQVITAYSAIANGGIMMKPYIVKEIDSPDGSSIRTQSREIRRVISERTALLVTGMLVDVIEGGHAVKAAVNGYYLAGKTGTAQVADSATKTYGSQTIQTFVGYGPVDDPKFVMLVKLDNPENASFAASSAAPMFSDIAGFILDYLQIPKTR